VLILVAIVVWHELAQEAAHGYPHAPQIAGMTPSDVGDMPVILKELGTVTHYRTVTYAQTSRSELFDEFHFQEGQDVEKGRFWAKIDTRPYQAPRSGHRHDAARPRFFTMAQMDLTRSQTARHADPSPPAVRRPKDQAYVVIQTRAR